MNFSKFNLEELPYAKYEELLSIVMNGIDEFYEMLGQSYPGMKRGIAQYVLEDIHKALNEKP